MWCTWTIDAHTYVSSRLIMYDAAKEKGGERITHMPHTAWKKPFCYSRQRAQVIDSPWHVRAKLISQVPKRLFCVPNAKKWRCHGWGRSDQLCLPTPKPTLLMQPATTWFSAARIALRLSVPPIAAYSLSTAVSVTSFWTSAKQASRSACFATNVSVDSEGEGGDSRVGPSASNWQC